MTVSESIQRDILAFFSEHLAQKTSRGGKRTDSAELQSALGRKEAAALWGLWIDRVQERAARLDLARWREEISAVPCGEGSLFAEIISFAADSADCALHIDTVSPAQWLKMANLALPLWDEGEHLSADDPLRQILFGEIRLLFGLLYPELDAISRFPELARQSILEGILTLTNSCGFPASGDFSHFNRFTASWMRALKLADSDSRKFLTAAAQKRLEKALMVRLRLMRSGGGFYFDETSPSAEISPEKTYRQILDGISDALLQIKLPQNRYLAKWIADAFIEENPEGKKTAALYGSTFHLQTEEYAVRKSKNAEDAACFSEAFPLAILRSPDNWTCGAAAAVLPAEESRYRWEIDCAGFPLIQGEWPVQARWKGKVLLPAGGWTSLCEEKNCERIYSEMMLPLTDGWQIERQLLWTVDESILLAADSIIGPEEMEDQEGEIEYTSSLALSPYFELIQDRAGYEIAGYKADFSQAAQKGRKRKPRKREDDPLVRIVPLTLPEWQADTTRGTFSLTGQGPVLTMKGQGTGLYAAYVFDFDKTHLARPYTWRKLTVGRNMTKTPDFEAVGYRYQTGIDTYLIYKSLGESVPRSVLGEHFNQNFVFARFTLDRKAELILEVEPPDEE